MEMIAPLARTACVLAGALVATLPAVAQDYPKRPIELVVPFVAGGTTDNIARLMAQRFSESWGQTVVVNNRAGGGSTIGTNAVAKAPPDGHTLLVTTIGFAINAGLQKLPYDPVGDFTPVTELASLPLVLVVHASVPATNLQEFIALAKSKPGGWDYASSGTGTSPHLAAEMFKSMAGIELVHVPFKGNAEAMNSLMGGHVKIYFALVPAVLQHIKTGALRAIAVTTEERLPYLPDVPTIAELGFPGYEISSWQGVFAPAGTPKDVVGKINGELVRMLNVPEIRRRISQEGADPVGSTPDAFATRVKNEITKWTKVIKTSGIQASN
jgi:tripartite-type tricarboxylate transporter receptor subunit TctC